MACVKRINAEQWRLLEIVGSFVCLFCLFKVCRGWKERLAFKYQDIRVCLTQSLRLVVRERFYEEERHLTDCRSSRNKFTYDPATKDAVHCSRLL